MTHQKLASFCLIGISVRTTNENGQAGKDIPALWNRFMSEGIAAAIPNKVDESIYCIYTDYEKDHTRPYTTILGCRVTSLATIPVGMIGITSSEGAYSKFIAKGNIRHGIVFDTWTTIWNSNLNRAFTTDFEVYGEKAQNPENSEVEIFVALK